MFRYDLAEWLPERVGVFRFVPFCPLASTIVRGFLSVLMSLLMSAFACEFGSASWFWLPLGDGTRGFSSFSNVSINDLIGLVAFFMSVSWYASLFPSIF